MGGMKPDILTMKEPVFAVRPLVVFAMWGEAFSEQVDSVEDLCPENGTDH